MDFIIDLINIHGEFTIPVEHDQTIMNPSQHRQLSWNLHNVVIIQF